MSKLKVTTISDPDNDNTAISIDTSGNITIPNNATFSGTVTGAGGGKVLQVVTGEYSTKETTTSTSFIDTGFTVNITPTDATTKMLIFVSAYAGAERTDQNIYTAKVRLRESTTSTTLPSGTYGFGFGAHIQPDNSFASRVGHHVTGSVYHDHNTTSQLTYILQYGAVAYAGYLNTYDDSTILPSTITIMEIAQWI